MTNFILSYNQTSLPQTARLLSVLNQAIEKHAPIKQRYVRANQAPFINKTINKEIMKRSRLRNKFLNAKSDIDSVTLQIIKHFGRQ